MTVCTVFLLKVAEWGERKTRMQQLLQDSERIANKMKDLNEEVKSLQP